MSVEQMKSTVYIPNRLWDAVRMKVLAEKPDIDGKPSKILRVALEHFTGGLDQGRPAYSRERPPQSTEMLLRIRERLSHEARVQYEEGYEAGLALADRLRWEELDSLVTRASSFAALLEAELRHKRIGFDEELVDDDEDGPVYDYPYAPVQRGNVVVEAIAKASNKGHIYQTGFMDAIHAVWESVTGIPAPKSSDEPAGDRQEVKEEDVVWIPDLRSDSDHSFPDDDPY